MPWYSHMVTLDRCVQACSTRDHLGFMLRDEIQRQAQRHCDVSFTALPGGYSAWSSMDTLVLRGLVARTGLARDGPVVGARRQVP